MSNSENQNIEDEDLARVRQHVNALSEHFDTVHIFVTRHEEGRLGGTVNAQWGAGNWFARYGQIRHWVVKENEVARGDVREDS